MWSVLIQLQTFHSFDEIERVKIVESHEVPISSKNEHLSIVDSDTLAVSGTWFFSNDETMAFIVNYLLVELSVRSLLIANGLQSLYHGLGCWRKVPLLGFSFVIIICELWKKFLLFLHEFFVLVFFEYLFHASFWFLRRKPQWRSSVWTFVFLTLENLYFLVSF